MKSITDEKQFKAFKKSIDRVKELQDTIGRKRKKLNDLFAEERHHKDEKDDVEFLLSADEFRGRRDEMKQIAEEIESLLGDVEAEKQKKEKIRCSLLKTYMTNAENSHKELLTTARKLFEINSGMKQAFNEAQKWLKVREAGFSRGAPFFAETDILYIDKRAEGLKGRFETNKERVLREIS